MERSRHSDMMFSHGLMKIPFRVFTLRTRQGHDEKVKVHMQGSTKHPTPSAAAARQVLVSLFRDCCYNFEPSDSVTILSYKVAVRRGATRCGAYLRLRKYRV